MSEGESKDDWTNLLATEALVLRSGQSWADIVDDDDEDIEGSDEPNRKHKESMIATETIESNEKPVDYLEDIDITVPHTQVPSKQTSNETRFDWDDEYNHNQEPLHPSEESDNWRVRDSKGTERDNWRVRDSQGDGPRKPTSFANFSNRDRFEKQEDRSDYRHPENRRVDPEDAAALSKWNTFHLVVAQEELEKEKEKERLKKRFLEGEQQKINTVDEGARSSELVKGDTNQQICINSNESQEKKIDQIQNTDKSKLDLVPTENLSTTAEIKDSEKSLEIENKKLGQGVTKENTQIMDDSIVLDVENQSENQLSAKENPKEVENTMSKNTTKPEEAMSEETKGNNNVIDETENDQGVKEEIINENKPFMSPTEVREDETSMTLNIKTDEDDSSDKKEEVISINEDQVENSTLLHDEEGVEIDSPKEEDPAETTNSETDHEKSLIAIKEDEEEANILLNHESDETIIPVAEIEETVEQEDSKESCPVFSEQQEEALEPQAVKYEQIQSSVKIDLPQKEIELQQDQCSKEENKSNVFLESENVKEKEDVDIEEEKENVAENDKEDVDVEEEREEKENTEENEKEDVKKESKVGEGEITTDEIDNSKVSLEEQTDKIKESQQEEPINNNLKEEALLEEIKEGSSTLGKQGIQETVLSNGSEGNEISEIVKEEKKEETSENESENIWTKDKNMDSSQPERSDTQNTLFIDNQNKTNDTLSQNGSSTSVTDQTKEFLDSTETNEADSGWSKESINKPNQTGSTDRGEDPIIEGVNSSAEPKKEETGWGNTARWTQESKKEVQTTESSAQGLPNEGSQWSEPKDWGNRIELNKDQLQVNDGASWNQKNQQDKTSWSQDQNSSNTMSTSTHSNSWGAVNKVNPPKEAAKKPSPGSWRSQIKLTPENDNAGGWKQFATNEAAINTVKETGVESPKPKKTFLPKNMQSTPKSDKHWNSETTSWTTPTDSWSKTSDITTQTTSSTSAQSDTHQTDSSWPNISKYQNTTKASPPWSNIQESHSKPSTSTNEKPPGSQTQNNWSKSQAWSATTQAQSQLKPHGVAAETQPTTQQQQPSNREPPVFNISLSSFDGVQLEHQKEVVKEEKKTVANAPIEINLSLNGGDIVMHFPTENINIMHAPLKVVLDDELQELQITPKIEHATQPVQQLHSSTTATSESTDFWSQHTQRNEWNMSYHDIHPEPTSSTESNGHKNRPRLQMDGSQWKLMNRFLKNK